MAAPKLIRPEWFTLDKYNELKANGYKDAYIANDLLYVSLSTLKRFKREIGWSFDGRHRYRGGRTRRHVDFEQIRYMKSVGKTNTEIGRLLGVCRHTIEKIWMEGERQSGLPNG